MFQEDAGEFSLGVCCSKELRGETPGREDSPSDLGEPELDPGGDAKTRDEKGFGRLDGLLSVVVMQVNIQLILLSGDGLMCTLVKIPVN